MGQEHLLLDPAIRDWVVIPMVVLLVIVGMGRHYVQALIKTEPVITASSLDELRHKQVLMQAGRLRAHGMYLNENAFNRRRANLIRKKTGLLREKVPGAANPMSNPMAMVDMMKGNIVFMLPNFAMMAFVGYFFSGFIVLKIPFPMLSSHFKLMLQRGVDLSTLDVSYVSSLSWYFLVTFGLNGVYRLILGDDSDFDDAKMMQMQMSMGMGGGAGQMGFDASAAYKQEKESLGIMKHDFVGEKAERQLLGDLYPDPHSGAPIDLSSFAK